MRGPDHAKHFQVCVVIGERAFAPCWGASKKAAEQAAALSALHELGLIELHDGGAATLVLSKLYPDDGEDAKAADKPAATRAISGEAVSDHAPAPRDLAGAAGSSLSVTHDPA